MQARHACGHETVEDLNRGVSLFEQAIALDPNYALAYAWLADCHGRRVGAHVFGGRWQALYDEVAAFKQACGAAHIKVILGTGDLLTLRNIGRASVVAMMAGADFIKTSTGKEPTNATLPVSLVMVRAIREYAQQTGMAVGFKPAGGIRTAKQSIDWLAMMKEELGLSWTRAELFRFGASGLLGDIERQLEHYATGRYSAEYRHPIA